MKLEVVGNYFYKNKQPFFWLGDTAWLLFEKLSLEEAFSYLEQRKSLGYNVIQCVLIHTYKDGFSCAGKSPNTLEYWEEVQKIVAYAQKLDLIMGILPAWGAIVKQGILNTTNVKEYADFLNQTFKGLDNIVWVLGGDIRGDENFQFYDSFGKYLKKLNPERLITFHPFGRTASYQWFKDCNWIDFHMFQSGHRRYDQVQLNAWDDKKQAEDVFGEDNYKYVMKNKKIIPFKPCLDGEPSYEGIPQGLHDITQPYWQAKDVRRYAYWSVFEGACGFTYGNSAIMQFHRENEEGSYGVKEVWQDALNMPGSKSMRYLKELMEEVPFSTGQARGDMVVHPKPFYEHISVFAGEGFIFCYSFLGKPFELNLMEYKNKRLKAYWMNPESGEREVLQSFYQTQQITFTPKSKEDWVLLMEEI